MDDEFPRILSILKNERFVPKINSICRGEFGEVRGAKKDFQLTWQRRENNYRIDPSVKKGVFIGIAADTVVGAVFEPNANKTLTIYGLQTYLILFDVDKFEILQSFPMRIKSGQLSAGRTGINNELISELMLNHLGYQPPQKGYEKIWLPNMIRQNLDKIDLNSSKAVNLRVTDVTLGKMTREWLAVQNKDENLYKGFLGHSLTSSISENFQVGIQPHSPSKATFTITQSFVAGGRSTNLFQKNLNTAPIDLELRLRIKGIIVEKKDLKRYDGIVKRKDIAILLRIEGGRWERTYAASDKQQLNPIKIQRKERIFRNDIQIDLSDLTVEEFGNDWQLVLDLQSRSIDWFMKSLYNEKYQDLASGDVQRGDQRYIKMQVKPKDVEKFINECKALRSALLKNNT